MRGEHHLGAERGDPCLEQVDLGDSVGIEAVDRDDARQSVDLLDVSNMPLEIDDSGAEGVEVLVGDRLEVVAAVVLQGAHGRDDDDG